MADWENRIVGHGEESPDQLAANPRNWRIHPQRQQKVLEGAIKDVGYLRSVTVNRRTGYVLDGHLRVSLAISSGQQTIPVEYVDLSEEEEGEALATLDPIAAMAATDAAQLTALMESISEADAHVLDFLTEQAAELEARLEPAAGLSDPDEVPEAPEEPVSKRGDVWLLGEHRLMCGDATAADDVGRVLSGAVPLLCVTDPPYGVAYDPAWRNRAAAEGKLPYAASRIGPVSNDERADWSEAWALFPGDVIYSWHPADATSLVHAAALQRSGFNLRMQIIWAKSNFPIGRGDYHVRHEPCWYAVRDGRAAHRTPDRTQTTLWEINLDKNVEGGHSTQKPVECMARPMRNHDADAVYDPFCGSGTSVIAAHREGRRCFALEIEPQYVDVICRRYQEYTGNLPILEATGETHDFTREKSAV